MTQRIITKADIRLEWTIPAFTMAMNDIQSIDLRHEAERLDALKVDWEFSRFSIDGESTWVNVLYVPSAMRAGVAWGADADWTDANSAVDAIERYFGIDGKEVVK